jgi:glycerol-3-phosphate O-acyltransferase/dihydroxyacetone phosphate acyltransferase
MKDRRKKSDKVKMEAGGDEDDESDSDEDGYNEARKKNI